MIGFAVIASTSAYAAIPQERPGDPLSTLTADLLDRFDLGKVAFELVITEEAGLGPIFNQTSCGSCHNNPVGGPGTQTVTRFGTIDPKSGVFDALAALGGSLLQAQSISEDCAEIIPPEATITSLRVTNSALAFGLIEAISDADMIAIRDAQPVGQRGEVHMVPLFEDPKGGLRVGRFGWKAQVATVLTFSADAAQNEMGLSNRFLPFDNAPNGDEAQLALCDTVADPEDGPDGEGFDFIDRVTDFQRFLAPPPQTPQSGMTGEVVFNTLGCNVCHTPSFTTSSDPLEPQLSNIAIKPYGDFLLHNMGLAGDGIVQGDADGTQLKTPPLWGVSYRDPLWHDGRFTAGTFESRITDAIQEHGLFGSQGIPAADAFAAASGSDKDALIQFLASLGQVEFDGDYDGDVELNDFHGFIDTIGFRGCYLLAVTPDDPCAIHDVDQDGDVDLDDFDIFLLAFDGVPADCNKNGTVDMLDILLGEPDKDNDGIPDVCQVCVGDFNEDGMVGIGDILAVIAAWGPCVDCVEDIDDNDVVDITDLLTLIANWGPCP
jgi:CxxC motif-containing protein (DUF1111 family)